MIYFLIISSPIAAGLLLIVLGCNVLGSVFKDEYIYHHNQWINDGKPIIGIWTPHPESYAYTYFKSLWAGTKHQIKWLFVTPPWIIKDKKVFSKLWIYRIITPLGFLIFTLYLILLASGVIK
jgi:hypothetical protein